MDGPVTVIIIIIVIINFSQKDRGHTKGEPVLGAPQYTHTYIHTITKTKYKKQAKTINTVTINTVTIHTHIHKI